MPNIFSGTVFDVGSSSQRGQSFESFMKSMGAKESEDVVTFDPMSHGDVPLEADSTMADSYMKAIVDYNNFGMAMARKGININKPSGGPEQQKAMVVANRLRKQIEQEGVAIKTSFELSKEHAKARLKPGVVGPQIDGKRPTTIEDLENLVNTNPHVKMLQSLVDDINGMAKSYSTEVERDDANLLIEERVKNFSTIRQNLLNTGIPQEFADLMISNAQNGVRRATFNPMKEKEFDLKESRNRALNAASRAAARRSSKGDEPKNAQGRKDLISAIQTGNQGAVNALVGAKHGKGVVSSAQYEPGITDAEGEEGRSRIVLSVVSSTTGGEEDFVVFVDEENAGGFFDLNNLLNTVKGQEEVDDEDFDHDTRNFKKKLY